MTVGQQFGFETPFHGSIGWRRMYGDQEVSQFRGAELIARNWQISRIEMEQWALQSHARARSAIENGRFENEIVPVGDFRVDECPRETSLEKMAALPTLLPDGVVTAASASQICDGASAVLVASAAAVARHSLTPRARIHHLSARGADPIFMLSAPIPATKYALGKCGLSIDDIDVVEINEAFRAGGLGVDQGNRRRSRPGECQRRCDLPSGTRSALPERNCSPRCSNELERTGGRFGLQTICEGGGTANVTIIERLG